MWFTDTGSAAAIGRITPCSPLPCIPTIQEFSTGLNSGSGPNYIAPAADGNMWFTDFGATKAIGVVGTGASSASKTPPAVTGAGRALTQQVCGGASWSTWLGAQPSTHANQYDGYKWLLDGVPLCGQTSQTYTPTLAQVGHQLSCRVMATYPLPLLVTAVATSRTVKVLPPTPPRVKVTSAKVSSKHHRTKFSFKALGFANGLQCALVRKPKHGKKKAKPQAQAGFVHLRGPRHHRRRKRNSGHQALQDQ